MTRWAENWNNRNRKKTEEGCLQPCNLFDTLNGFKIEKLHSQKPKYYMSHQIRNQPRIEKYSWPSMIHYKDLLSDAVLYKIHGAHYRE